MVVGGGAGLALARAGGGAALGAVRAGTSMGSAASTAYKLGQETSGSSSVGAGLSGVGTAMKGAATNLSQRTGSKIGLGAAADAGRDAAWNAGTTREKPSVAVSSSNVGAGRSPPASSAPAARDGAPPWAADMKADQRRRSARQAAVHVISDGSRGGSGASPDIAEKED
jgi:type IV secretion system protein TrbL